MSFGQLTKETSVEEAKEFTNRSFILPTDVYKAVIEQAFVQKVPAKSGGFNYYMNWKLKVHRADGSTQDVRVPSQFIAKEVNGSLIYFYEKEGKKNEYVSFAQLRRALDTIADIDIFKAKVEVRTIPVYDYKTKQEVPTQVEVYPEILGKEVVVGLEEVHENGYKDPTQIIKTNQIALFWRLVDGKPFSKKEITAGLTEPADVFAWKESHKGKPNTSNLKKDELAVQTSVQTKTLEIG